MKKVVTYQWDEADLVPGKRIVIDDEEHMLVCWGDDSGFERSVAIVHLVDRLGMVRDGPVRPHVLAKMLTALNAAPKELYRNDE